MAIYMTQFSYTPEAWGALVRNPEDRTAGITSLLESVGARLIELYYSFGEYDGVLIFEAPDETTATAALLGAISPGHLKATKTPALYTVQQGVEAMKKAGSMGYAGPEG